MPETAKSKISGCCSMGGKMVLYAETLVSLSCWMPCCEGDSKTFAADDWLLASHTIHSASNTHTIFTAVQLVTYNQWNQQISSS